MRVNVLLLTSMAAVLLVVAQPAGGSAASCAFDPGAHVVTAVLDADVTSHLVRTAGGEIQLASGDSPPSPCGEATVLNTDKIQVTADVGSELVISARDGLFAPGYTPEAGGDEIEILLTAPESDNALTYESTVAPAAGTMWRASTAVSTPSAASSM